MNGFKIMQSLGKVLLGVLFLVLLLVGCNSKDLPIPNGYFNVETPSVVVEARSLSLTIASLSGIILNRGNVTIEELGFVWKDTPNPLLGNAEKIAVANTPNNEFSKTLLGLMPNTTYYFKAFIKTKLDTFYSDQLVFTTPRAWTQIQDFPLGEISSMFGFSPDNETIIVGGGKGNKEVYEYNISKKQWVLRGNFLGKNVEGAVGFSIFRNDGIVATGSMTNEVWSFNNNTWTKKKNFPGDARQGAIGFVIAGDAYLGLGEGADGKLLNDFWKYNETTDTWTQLKNFPGDSRKNATAFAISADGYVGMGEGSIGYLNDFWKYDKSSDSWNRLANFPGSPRSLATGVGLSSEGLIGAGKNGSGLLKDFWSFLPSKNTWSQTISFPGKATAAALGFNVSSTGYVIGGTASNECWQYLSDK